MQNYYVQVRVLKVSLLVINKKSNDCSTLYTKGGCIIFTLFVFMLFLLCPMFKHFGKIFSFFIGPFLVILFGLFSTFFFLALFCLCVWLFSHFVISVLVFAFFNGC